MKNFTEGFVPLSIIHVICGEHAGALHATHRKAKRMAIILIFKGGI
jgi:hypothetical protein